MPKVKVVIKPKTKNKPKKVTIKAKPNIKPTKKKYLV